MLRLGSLPKWNRNLQPSPLTDHGQHFQGATLINRQIKSVHVDLLVETLGPFVFGNGMTGIRPMNIADTALQLLSYFQRSPARPCRLEHVQEPLFGWVPQVDMTSTHTTLQSSFIFLKSFSHQNLMT